MSKQCPEVDASPPGDTRFPEWNPNHWREVARDERDGFAFVTYERYARG
jgi:dihydrofolate reductase